MIEIFKIIKNKNMSFKVVRQYNLKVSGYERVKNTPAPSATNTLSRLCLLLGHSVAVRCESPAESAQVLRS